jgi:hypothetical protein
MRGNTMSNASPFPKPPAPQLTRDEVIGYLAECQANGWSVYSEDPSDPHSSLKGGERFSIRLHEQFWIFVHFSAGDCSVSALVESVSYRFGNPQTVRGLDELIARRVGDFVHIHGVKSWAARPDKVRFAKDRPATNYTTLAGLIGQSTIEAIFDPYFDDKALAVLGTLMTFGVNLSPNGRILTSPKGAAKLTPAYKAAWLLEHPTACEFHKQPANGAHRRFMLLSGGQTLILGMSLNSIGKDEAAHLEAEPADLVFFNAEWASSVPV